MLTSISNAITQVFKDFATPFLYFIKISSICGNLLVDSIACILYYTFESFISIKELLIVFWDDYTFFVSEFLQSIYTCGLFLINALRTASYEIVLSIQSLNLLAITALQHISSAFELSLKFCGYLASAIWQLFTLVCSGFSFIGSCVIAAIITTPKTICEWLLSIPETFSNGISTLQHSLSTTFRKMDVITNIEGSGFLAGLVGLIVFVISVAYYEEILNSFIFISRQIYSTIINLINQYWTGEFLENANRNTAVYEPPLGTAGIDEPTLCIICLSAPKNILYMPCRHCCICKSCSDIMKARTCLLCRKRIRNTIQIYN